MPSISVHPRHRWYASIVAITCLILLPTFGLHATGGTPQLVQPGRPATYNYRFAGIPGSIVRTISVVDDGLDQFIQIKTAYKNDSGNTLATHAFRFGEYTTPFMTAAGSTGTGATGPSMDANLIVSSLVYDPASPGSDADAVAALAEAANGAHYASADSINCYVSEWVSDDGCVHLLVICWDGSASPNLCTSCLYVEDCPNSAPTVNSDCCWDLEDPVYPWDPDPWGDTDTAESVEFFFP